MYRIGLKLWSVNTDFYLREAKRLYAERVFDYLEIYFVPGSLDTLSNWKSTGIPCVVHAPHSAHGVNLASREAEPSNMLAYEDVKRFADGLSADIVIAHGGVLGSVDEVVRQLELIGDSRIIIENKPYLPIDGTPRLLAGSTPGEIGKIIHGAGCGFCLDIGHAVAAANAHGVDWRGFLDEFLALGPRMFHLSDIDTTSKVDQHLHFGDGNLPIDEILSKIPSGATISVETGKGSKTRLDDFAADAACLMQMASLRADNGLQREMS